MCESIVFVHVSIQENNPKNPAPTLSHHYTRDVQEAAIVENLYEDIGEVEVVIGTWVSDR
jgi:hypothetical protein